jgi:phenylacetate-CoA ligase
MPKQQAMQDKIGRKLETALGVHAKVRLVEPGSTPRSEGKAVRVIDKRKPA